MQNKVLKERGGTGRNSQSLKKRPSDIKARNTPSAKKRSSARSANAGIPGYEEDVLDARITLDIPSWLFGVDYFENFLIIPWSDEKSSTTCEKRTTMRFFKTADLSKSFIPIALSISISGRQTLTIIFF